MSEQYKSKSKESYQIADSVFAIHLGEKFTKTFNRKMREWEIRRGFRKPDAKPVLRGVALRASRSAKKTSKASKK